MTLGELIVSRTSITRLLRLGLTAAIPAAVLLASLEVRASQEITDINFDALPDGQLSISLDFSDGDAIDYSSYTIEDPARIVIDFPETQNRLPQRRYALPDGNASSVVVLEAGDRSRMIVNMSNLGSFNTAVLDGRFVLEIAGSAAGSYSMPALAGWTCFQRS